MTNNQILSQEQLREQLNIEQQRVNEALKDPSEDEVNTAIKEYVDHVGPKHASMRWALKWFLECRRLPSGGDAK